MDSRTALLNAPRRRRQIVALLAPALAAILLIALAAAALAGLRDRAALLDERRSDLGRLEALLAAMPPPGAGTTVAASDADFLAGDNDALVQAAFQTRLREIAAASGAEVIAVGNLPITLRADTRFAGLRASLSGTNDALVAAIFAIETSRPYLTIRSARIDSYPPGRDTGPQKLLLQVEFEGALRPEAGAEAAGPAADGAGPPVE